MSLNRFQGFLSKNDLRLDIREFKDFTTTAQQAAEVHGVPVSNIVKSLVAKVGDEFILFLCPGDQRIDFEKVKKDFNAEEARMANADEVKGVTGYSIGGVPPFGHKKKMKTVIMGGFKPDEPIVAAAGSNKANFRTKLSELRDILNSLGVMDEGEN